MTIRTLARRLSGPWLIVALFGSALSMLIGETQRAANLAADHFRSFASHMLLARYSEARLEIEKAVRLSPGNAYYASSFGLLEERAGGSFGSVLLMGNKPHIEEQGKEHVEAAIHWYEEALRLNPNDGSFHHNLGWLRGLLNQNEQALDHFKKALLLEPNNAMFRISHGLFCERSGMIQDAVSEYSLGVRLSPGVVDSRFFSALRQRWPSGAEEAVGNAINNLEAQQTSDPVLKARLGKLYLYSDRVEAMETLKRVTVELPYLPRPWLNLGILLERQQQNEEAERCFEKSVFLGGDYSALLRLGRLNDRAGRTAHAIRCYESAIESWRWKASEGARNIRRVYQSADIVPDNVVPRGFLSYIQPDFDLRATCSRLAILHRMSGNAERADYYDDLGKRADL